MQIVSISNARYSRPGQSAIDCDVQFSGLSSPVPFTATAADTTAHGQAIWQGLNNGTYGNVAAYEAPPAPVPAVVSDRQFAQALALSGFITEDEAVAWAGAGTIPAALDFVVASIPDPAARFSAKMLLASATTYERAHPLVETVRLAQELTSAQVDDLFRLAGSL
jgi:hypothetical protein